MYVKKGKDDNTDTNVFIADRLRSKGVTVTTGAGTAPSGVDAEVTYVEKWMWDITMYLLELTITIRDPKTDFPMASGNSYHTSWARKSPQEMSNEVVDNIYKSAKEWPIRQTDMHGTSQRRCGDQCGGRRQYLRCRPESHRGAKQGIQEHRPSRQRNGHHGRCLFPCHLVTPGGRERGPGQHQPGAVQSLN